MSQPDRARLYNALTIAFLALTALSGGLAAWIAIHPQGPLNPFPPAPTPTLMPTAAPPHTPTLTLTPSLTITPTITPTRTLTPTPSLTPTITPTFTPLPTLAPAWMEVLIEEAGYAMHLPNTWVVFDLTGRDPRATLEQIADENPALYASFDSGLGNAYPNFLSLLAFDSASVDAPFIITMNISRADLTEGRTVEEVWESREAFYGEDSRYTLLSSGGLSIDGQPAAQIYYTTELEAEVEVEAPQEGEGEDEGAATPATEVVLLTIHHRDVIVRRPEGGMLVITFAIDSERLEGYEPLVDQILSTWRFVQ
jgi:hypothetical protein